MKKSNQNTVTKTPKAILKWCWAKGLNDSRHGSSTTSRIKLKSKFLAKELPKAPKLIIAQKGMTCGILSFKSIKGFLTAICCQNDRSPIKNQKDVKLTQFESYQNNFLKTIGICALGDLSQQALLTARLAEREKSDVT